MNKKQRIYIIAFFVTAIILSSLITSSILARAHSNEVTHLKDSRTACQQIAQSYILNTQIQINVISNPSLFNRQQAKLSIDESQALASELTDICLN